MYYDVPSKPTRTEKLKPIFPWEEHAPKPTRVFPEERQPSPEPEVESDVELEPELEAEPESKSEPVAEARTSSDASESPASTKESRSSSNSASESDPWNSYTRVNAWDAMPEIERYVQAFVHSRKGKVEVLHQAAPYAKPADQSSSSSPPANTKRRPSMKITDFPTEWERPSLPVTPAPRHPSFWGEERDEEGELPAAEGVPKQQDWVSRFSSYSQPNFDSSSRSTALRVLFWRCQYCGKQNPVEKLEELQKRQSEVLQTGPEPRPKEIPKRAMPGAAVDTAAVTAGVGMVDIEAKTVTNARPPAKPKSILKDPSFELGGLSSEKDSPTSNDVAPEVLSLSPDVSASA